MKNIYKKNDISTSECKFCVPGNIFTHKLRSGTKSVRFCNHCENVVWKFWSRQHISWVVVLVLRKTSRWISAFSRSSETKHAKPVVDTSQLYKSTLWHTHKSIVHHKQVTITILRSIAERWMKTMYSLKITLIYMHTENHCCHKKSTDCC